MSLKTNVFVGHAPLVCQTRTTTTAMLQPHIMAIKPCTSLLIGFLQLLSQLLCGLKTTYAAAREGRGQLRLCDILLCNIYRLRQSVQPESQLGVNQVSEGSNSAVFGPEIGYPLHRISVFHAHSFRPCMRFVVAFTNSGIKPS